MRPVRPLEAEIHLQTAVVAVASPRSPALGRVTFVPMDAEPLPLPRRVHGTLLCGNPPGGPCLGHPPEIAHSLDLALHVARCCLGRHGQLLPLPGLLAVVLDAFAKLSPLSLRRLAVSRLRHGEHPGEHANDQQAQSGCCTILEVQLATPLRFDCKVKLPCCLDCKPSVCKPSLPRRVFVTRPKIRVSQSSRGRSRVLRNMDRSDDRHLSGYHLKLPSATPIIKSSCGFLLSKRS